MAVVKVGSTFEHLAERRGDYEHWFQRMCGLSDEQTLLVRARAGDALPEAQELAGVIVTGSAALITDREPWSERTGAWMAGLLDSSVPLLGVCYGHQLLAQAMGAPVDFNPRGRQMGTAPVRLCEGAEEDPLFAGLPLECSFQVSHRQSVLALPEGATLLATSPRDPVHAFRASERAWGVQFHPEFDADISTTYVSERRDAISGEGDDPDALIEAAHDTDHGERLLRRFAELCGF